MLVYSIYEGLAMLPALILACKMNRTFGQSWSNNFGSEIEAYFTDNVFVTVSLGIVALGYLTKSLAVSNLYERYYKPQMYEHGKYAWVFVIIGLPLIVVIVMFSYIVMYKTMNQLQVATNRNL